MNSRKNRGRRELVTAVLLALIGAVATWVVSASSRSFEGPDRSFLNQVTDFSLAHITLHLPYLLTIAVLVALIYVISLRRKHAHDALREQQALTDAILSATPNILAMKDRNGVHVTANQAFCQLLGRSESDIVGKTDLDLLPEAIAERFRQADAKVMASGEQRVLDVEMPGKMGIRWYQAVITPWIDRDGNCIGVLCSATDITVRKRVEQSLWIKDSAIESSASATVLADLNGHFVYANQAFVDLLGYQTDEDAKNECSLETMLTEGEWSQVSKALADKGKWLGERHAVRRDGSHFHVYASASMVMDEDDQPLCFECSFFDIESQKLAEAALRESEENFHALAANAYYGIVVSGPDTSFLYVNDRMARMSGYTVDEILTMKIGDMVPAADLDDIKERNRKRIAGEEPLAVSKSLMICKDGSELPVEAAAAKTTWQGTPAVIVIIRDISAQGQAEKDLRESEENFRTLAENCYVGIGAVDDEYHILYVNGRLADMLGYTVEEMIGMNSLDTVAPDEVALSKELHDQVMAGMVTPPIVGVHLVRKDGSHVSVEAGPTRTTWQGKLAVMLVFRDQTA